VRVVAICPDPPPALLRLRRDLHLDFPVVSDAWERSVAVLCGGLAHCFVLLDAAGTVRWAARAEVDRVLARDPAPGRLSDAAC
jgi:peroxiredoxin